MRQLAIVGTGKYTYRLHRDWAKPPAGERLDTVSDVATDSQDRLFVLQRGSPPVLVFDREGNHLNSWQTDLFNRPHGICIVDDFVYLTDSDDSMTFKFALDGTLIQSLGSRGVHSDTGTEEYVSLVPRAAGPFNHPTKMVPSPEGELYVSDGERNSRVHRFSTDGKLVASWGEPGKNGANQFHMPHSVLVDRDGRVYVCDRENSCVQIFSTEGHFISMWSNLRPPSDIVVDQDGAFHVSQFAFNIDHRYSEWAAPAGSGSALKDDAGRRTIRADAPPQISILNREGGVLAEWDSRKGHGLCLDSRGNIYLALEDESSVDKYTRQS